MTIQTGRVLKRLRQGSQIAFALVFFYLFFASGFSGLAGSASVQPFFYFDPLLLVVNVAATETVQAAFLLSLILVVLTLAFGRFFCSWVCPFGSVHHFFSWISKKQRSVDETLQRKPLKVKYVVLTALVISAVLGTNLAGWLDPFSFLTRSLTVLVPSADYLVDQSLAAVQGADSSFVAVSLKPLYDVHKRDLAWGIPAASTQSVLLGGVFVIVIALNFMKRRFFCNTLCPLGALLGIFARWGLLRIQSGPRCTSCHLCVRQCTYDGNPGRDYLPSECTSCFNCVVECRQEAVTVGFELPARRNRIPIDVGRRKLMGALASGVVLAALPKASLEAQPKTRHMFMRPPGALPETDFLAECVRCGQCLQTCPTNFIQPAFLEAGIEGLWTPILNPQSGACAYECNKCNEICPTGAIARLTLKQKKAWKIGTASVDRSRCFTHVDGFNCTRCEEDCPIPQKAIRFRQVEMANPRGQRAAVNQVYVMPELCTGCGICEHVCPRRDAPGIVVTAEDETRELTFL